MPIKYFYAIPLLLAAGMSIAEADQKENPTATTAKTGAKKAPTSAAASAPAAATTMVGASATAASTLPVAATPVAPGLPELPMFKFGGFGSLGVSHSSLNQGDYVIESSMPKGVGRSSNWTASNNTRAAVHMTAYFTPEVSAVCQIDSEYRSDGTYSPEIEWLNVKYAFTPNAYMRLGRIALPTFIDSENHDVGYSYVWVNPPVDLYHQLPISSSDGVDFVYRSEIGEASNSIKAIYGTSTHERPNSVSTSKDMWGIFDTIEYGQALFHISYQQRRESTRSLQMGVDGPWIRNTDLSVGASYDPGKWFVISEWVQRRSTSKISAMYVSGGYRIEKFTPYLLYSQNSPGSFYSTSTPPTAAAVERANRAQSTISLGVRWDFMRNYDFKFQYDRVKLSDNSNGYLVNVPAGVTLYGSRFYVVSAVVDFVF